MKHMKRITTIQGEPFKNEDMYPIITNAVVNNLLQYQPECEWVELTDALKGPAHVAKMLIQHCEKRRSTPTRPYKLNAEQLECTALFVSRLEKAFAERDKVSEPWIHPARVIMTIIMDGRGEDAAKRP